MATINDTGITIKTLSEYLAEIKEAYTDIDSGWNVNAESLDGQQIAIWSELMALYEEALANAYASVDPNTAIGQQLDRIGAISGVYRQDATFSTVQDVVFTGVDGTFIPQGTQIRHRTDDTLWSTDTGVTISGGTATTSATAVTGGALSAAVGTLTIIASPVGGAQSVTNNQSAIIGSDEETDANLRIRRNLSVANPGLNQVDSIYAKLANIDGVTKLKIYENYGDAADSNGVEGHSMAIFIAGGDQDEIASVITLKSPGCGLNANNTIDNKVTLATTTPGGRDFTATFFRPESVDVYVDVQASGTLPDGSEDLIKEAIVEYANATLFEGSDTLGFDTTGFDIGEVIPAGKLFTPVNSVVGPYGYAISILLGTDSGNVTLTSIDPGFNGVGTFTTDNITVTIS